MDCKLHSLANGLRVLTVAMPSLKSATVAVWVKTGSRKEEARINGISHFLEHMVFKGSKKRPSAKQISEAVDAIGGEFNAGTSKDWTNFYIKVGSGNLTTAFDVLSDMVLNPILKAEEITREKGVIIEEINMYEDTPMMKISDVFENIIFKENALGWDTAGTVESVKRIARSDFERYRDIHYYPENMLVTVAGGVSEKNALKLAEKYFSLIKNQNASHPLGGPFKSRQAEPQVKLHPKKKEQAHFILGFLADGRVYKNRFAQAVLATILGGGMSSRLFLEVRERRGLAYAVKTGVERYQETGYLSTYVGADPKRVEEAITVTLEQCYGISNFQLPISNKEFLKAKEYLKGHLALALEDTKDVSMFFADQALFLEEILTPEKVMKKIDAVRLDDIYFEAKRLFVPSRLNLAIIGPYESEEKFVKLLK